MREGVESNKQTKRERTKERARKKNTEREGVERDKWREREIYRLTPR